jgi:Tfp pilus assembly protein PilV
MKYKVGIPWRSRGKKAGSSGSRAGITVLEATIALAVVSTVLIASAGAFSSSLSSVTSSQRRSRGTVFLQTVMENLTAQPYDNLLTFNGNRIYDQNTMGASNYYVDVTVFTAATDLEQVQTVLRDMRTNREIGRVTTLRSKR